MDAYGNNGSEGDSPPPSFWDDFTVLGVPRSKGRDPLKKVKEKLESDYKEQEMR